LKAIICRLPAHYLHAVDFEKAIYTLPYRRVATIMTVKLPAPEFENSHHLRGRENI